MDLSVVGERESRVQVLSQQGFLGVFDVLEKGSVDCFLEISSFLGDDLLL